MSKASDEQHMPDGSLARLGGLTLVLMNGRAARVLRKTRFYRPTVTILLQFILLTVMCVLGGCSRSEQKVASAQPVAVPAEFNSVQEFPAELRSELESFARQFEADIHSGDSSAVQAAFDLGEISERICEGIKGTPALLNQYKNGLQTGLTKSSNQLAQQWSEADSKYKGLVLYKGSPSARFRFAGDAGVALVDLVLRRNSQGKVRIVNLYNHAMGYDMVQQARQMAAPMLADMDKGFLARLVDKPNISPSDMNRFADMAKKFSDQDYAGVVSAYESLSPALSETMTASMMYINALEKVGKDEEYKQALEEAGKRFNSASFQIMLVDVHFLDKEYDKAIECIDNFMETLEKDAAYLALKSSLLHAKGDIKGAVTVLDEAFKLEPDCIFAHSKGLDVLLAAKDFARVRDSMLLLEEKAGYDFKGAIDDPVWDEFRKAPESKPWR